MIIRVWHAATTPTKERHYLDIVRRVVLPHFETMEGYRGAFFTVRTDGDLRRYTVLTYWTSMADVDRLTDGDVDHAFVPDEIRRTLEQADETVEHSEVVIAHAIDRLPEHA